MMAGSHSAPPQAAQFAGLLAGIDAVASAHTLQQCLALCATAPVLRAEPLRTLHHFSCTGGTLISKCIAALPNVQLLSEVDPGATSCCPTPCAFHRPTW